MNPLTCIDFYKADHRRQYPEGTQVVYSNFTPRSDKLAVKSSFYDGKVVFFGLQYFIKKYLIDDWNKEFFNKPKDEVVKRYKRRMDNSLGKDSIPIDHIENLHDLGYLPLSIRALNEGEDVNIGVPLFTVNNTKIEFFWLTNYIETVMSCMLWKPITSATTARQYRMMLDEYARQTGDESFVDFQAHDFSMRGMSGIEDAAVSGAAHLLSFKGTDTVPAIDFLEDWYNADSDKELIGCSVPATEHSVMCMGTKEDEIGTFKRLITEIYPSGIVSIVSDTWDLWKVLEEYAPALRNEIESRNGKVVFRPDSGDPCEIISKSLDILWDKFGGTINKKGYKVLNPKVGLIYGDSITLERCEHILHMMLIRGYASTNVVFGIGSYTYQYVTRDTFGFAMKATYGCVKGVDRDIFKSPLTDDGTKKSATGRLVVEKISGEYFLFDKQDCIDCGELKEVFYNGTLLRDLSLSEIRGVK